MTTMDESSLAGLAKYSGDPWTPSNSYFEKAEGGFPQLWERLIWPFISDCDFDVSLDLAAGHGRNGEYLQRHARRLWVTDIQAGNVEVCARRFASNAAVSCFTGNGYNFEPLTDGSLSFIYCFDAMVHFDSDVVRAYLRDARRVLRPGGRGFFHHSNYTAGHDWRTNPRSRNFMSVDMFRHYALKEGLEVVRQRPVRWAEIENLDGFTLVQRPL